MDYLKAFTIGTTGPVLFQNMASIALTDENYYDYSFKNYSLIAPSYYGLMSMFALYIGKTFKLSLHCRLFITSIISIILVVLLSYFGSRKLFEPYKKYTTKEWLAYILRNGSRHLINFNLIIYYFTKYFSDYYWLKVFIIGSSIFSYLISYLNISWLDNKQKINYITQPFIQGFTLIISLYVLQKIIGLKLNLSLIIWTVFYSLIFLFSIYKNISIKLVSSFFIIFFIRLISIVPIYFLLTNLK